MAVIVCFGDSNTWGADPTGAGRFAPDVRWTGVLADRLGTGHRVIEEGLNGRTTNLTDVIEEDRNGRSYLLPCLQSHAPFDLVMIMLGTNDLKARFNRSASDIAQSAVNLGQLARKQPVGPGKERPEVLIIAPPALVQPPVFDEMFEGGVEKSRQFSRWYETFVNNTDLHFMDAGAVIESSAVDGIHFDSESHRALGEAIADRIADILAEVS